MLERRGVISGYEGSKPRQVLVSEGELSRMLERLESGSEGEPTEADPEPVTAGESPDGSES